MAKKQVLRKTRKVAQVASDSLSFENFLNQKMAPLAKKEVAQAKTFERNVVEEERQARKGDDSLFSNALRNSAITTEAAQFIERVISRQQAKGNTTNKFGRLLQFSRKAWPVSLAAAALLTIAILINTKTSPRGLLGAQDADALMSLLPKAKSGSAFAIKSDHPIIKSINIGFYAGLAANFKIKENETHVESLLFVLKEVLGEFEGLNQPQWVKKEIAELLAGVKGQKISDEKFQAQLGEWVKRMKGALGNDRYDQAFQVGQHFAQYMVELKIQRDWELHENRLFEDMRKIMKNAKSDEDDLKLLTDISTSVNKLIFDSKKTYSTPQYPKRILGSPEMEDVLQKMGIHRVNF